MSNIVTTGTVNKNLKFVDNLADYKVHHNDTDIRGYAVRLASGEKIGEIEGLLADVPAKLVRYAEIEVDESIINRHTAGTYTDDDRHLLIPIGLVKINNDRSVTVSGILMDQMVDYPRFNRANGYTTGYELSTNKYLSGFHALCDNVTRDNLNNDRYRNSETLDDTFYSSKFYTGKFS